MKNWIVSVLMLGFLTNLSYADNIDDAFDSGKGEFKFERFSNQGILLEIDRQAKLSCDDDGLCNLSSVSTKGDMFEVTFNIGEGGGLTTSGGTTIVTGDLNSNSREYYGLTVTYKIGHCTQKVNVPKSVYYSVNRYIYGLMESDGSTKKGFTPSEEAMIMFYTTIMKQANGCQPLSR